MKNLIKNYNKSFVELVEEFTERFIWEDYEDI